MNGGAMLKVLVGLNLLVYLAWLAARDQPGALDFMAANFLVSLATIRAGYVWTLLTAEFSHMEFNHFIFNMLALWIFGRPTADALGPWRFLQLYIVGGVVSSFGYLLYQALTNGGDVPSLGASGAIMAISVVFAAMYPRTRLLVFGVIPATAPVVVAGYAILDVFGLAVRGGDGIAHAAHLGGAAYGLAYWLYLRRAR